MDWVVYLSVIAVAYALGSVPFAYLVARWLRGVDIRTVGSRNVGALNTFRHVGAAAGVAVLAADVAKGTLAALAPSWLGQPDWVLYGAVLAVASGHNWSVFLRFGGGRGVAPVLGVSLGVLPLLTVATIVPAALFILATRRAVLGIILGFILLNVLTVATAQPGSQVLLCLSLTILVGGVHFARSRRQYLAAFRDRRWAAILSIE